MGIKNLLTPEARERALKLAGADENKSWRTGQILKPLPPSARIWPYDEWLDIMRPASDAPLEFHWSTMRTCLGIWLSRRLYVVQAKPLYLNTNILLIGSSGLSRKSTTIGHGFSLMQMGGVPYRIIRHPESPKRIYQELARAPGTAAILYWDEMRALLAIARRPGTADMLAKLNYLYYCPDHDSVGGQDAIEIHDPFVSLITSAPLSWLEDSFRAGDITGGFMRRFIILPAERTKYIPRAPQPDPNRMKKLAEQIAKRIASLPPGGREMRWTKEAGTLWDTWATANDTDVRNRPEHTSALTAGIEEIALKETCLNSFLAGQEELTPQAVEIATATADVLKHNALRSLGDIPLTRTAKLEQRILKFAEAHNPFTFSDLRGELGGFYSRDETLRSLDTIARDGELEDDPGSPTKGKKGHRWRLAP